MTPSRSTASTLRKIILLSSTVLSCLVGQALSAQGTNPGLRERAGISVEDVVRQATAGDPGRISANGPGKVDIRSPNGERYALVIRRGNLASKTNDADLLVGDVRDLMVGGKPRLVAHFSSASNQQPIALVRWLSDNRTIIFAGTQGTAPTQIFRLDIGARVPKPLTATKAQLTWYDITADGKWLVTIDANTAHSAQHSAALRDGYLVEAKTLYGAEYGIESDWTPVTVYDLARHVARQLPKFRGLDADLDWAGLDFAGAISPDGRFAVRLCSVSRWPDWWLRYKVPKLMALGLKTAGAGTALRPVLIDLKLGTQTLLTDAPWPTSAQPPLWIDGGRRMILVGAVQSVDSAASQGEADQRSSHLAVLSVDPRTLATDRIAFLDDRADRVTAVRWHQDIGSLEVEARDSTGSRVGPEIFARVNGHWTRGKPLPPGDVAKAGPTLMVREAPDVPPTLVATDPATGKYVTIAKLDPWLKDRVMGRVEIVHWKAKDGRAWSGALYFPPDYDPGKRYPVILQTHGFDPARFTLNGAGNNFVGQPLAASGMVVLQIEERAAQAEVLLTPGEYEAIQAGYEAAIDYLDTRGIADRARIGIQGWSRSGVWVGYLLTHSHYPIAATALTETGDNGWWLYLANGATGGAREFEADNGAVPFGDGLEAWRKVAPTFNLDKVDSPVLMWSAKTPIYLWDWYAGLRRLGKPAEYWAIPDGLHDVFNVRQRLLTGHLLVDWFRFWLQGYEDRDSAKRTQYSRWRRLCDMRKFESSQSTFCVTTEAVARTSSQ
ncbi:MAG: hypothetical protein JWR80_6859 [Bradyrhizobium sp.]|nr:hypothetical protein [Bradyrhizobium sp.]